MNYNELKDKVKDSVTVPQIYSGYKAPVGELGAKGYVFTECPICGGSSFSLRETYFRCFKCEEKGDIFSLYSILNKSDDFIENLHSIARDFSIITIEDYDKVMKKKGKEKNKNKVAINIDAVKKISKKEKNVVPKATLQSREVLNNVYKTIKEISPITEKQRYALRKGRSLSNNRIDAQYFNMPFVGDKFYSKLFKLLKDRFNYSQKDLIGVPGFYSEDGINVKFVRRKGIGMLMAGSDSLVHGIQIRPYDEIDKEGNMILYPKLDKNGKPIGFTKYYWCSSDKYPYGCGPGAPVDVIFPLDYKNMLKTAFITEGKFKIEKLAETFNCPAISVQGVGNWINRISPEIKFINKNIKEIKHIYICFDSDLAFNFKIFNQCKKMVKEELSNLNVTCMIAVWDYHLGKGIDDVIQNGYRNKLKAINFYVFGELFEKYIKRIKELYPNTIETKILDENKNEVEEEIVYKIYKEMVLDPLHIYYL